MANTERCRHCGLEENRHCVFEPKSCLCDDGTWADRPRPVCEMYLFESGLRQGQNCKRCEHDEACHRGLAREPANGK